MLVAGGWLEKIAGAGSLLLLACGGWLRTVLLVHVGRLLGKGTKRRHRWLVVGWGGAAGTGYRNTIRRGDTVAHGWLVEKVAAEWLVVGAGTRWLELDDTVPAG